jgi:hypothetical protein
LRAPSTALDMRLQGTHRSIKAWRDFANSLALALLADLARRVVARWMLGIGHG